MLTCFALQDGLEPCHSAWRGQENLEEQTPRTLTKKNRAHDNTQGPELGVILAPNLVVSDSAFRP